MIVERLLKYLWFVIVMKITWPLPDWRPIMWLRGFLTRPCFKNCGSNLQLSSDVKINCSNNMIIKDNVYIAHGCWINAQGGIIIEDEVMLGPYTVLASGNHTMSNGSYRYGKPHRAKIHIHFGSWTGAGVKIMPGVTIGKSVCCAAGSVVINDIPDNVIVGGVPAKILKQ